MKQLFDAFKGYEFFPDDHHYEYNGKRVGTSVTTLIHEYSNPFDSEGVSLKVAEKTGQSQTAVLEKWRLENLHSTVKGTIVHEYAQGLWNGIENKVDYTNIKELDPLRLQISVESCNAQALQFYKEYNQTLEVLKDEFIVGSTEFDIAGSIDNLLIDKKTNDLILIDYKTNKKIDYNSFNGRRMLPPMDNLEDCNYIHYCLQLNIYKLLIEKYAAIPVKRIFLVYFDENKKEFEKIKILNLQKEALKLLQTRIC